MRLSILLAAQCESAREYDLAYEPFDGPVGIDKSLSEIVEQFG